MDSYTNIIRDIFNSLMLMVSIGMLCIAWRALKENTKTTKENTKMAYIQFYKIIERHHTEEITKLRRTVLEQLEDEAEKARSQNRLLIEVNPDIHLKASALANYYESLGMFLQGGWNLFPEKMKKIMLAMLHNSVYKTWPLFRDYKDVIYPDRPRDWAQSYQWLFDQISKYRKDKKL